MWQEKFAWFELLDAVVCSSDIGTRKPDSDFYQFVKDECGPSASAPVFVDDLQENVEAAIEAGFRGVLGDGSGLWQLEVIRDG
jgi:HAD superfamily hydrolase (TIGR01509 family)